MPFYSECECKKRDVVFVVKNQTFEAVVTANRHLALLGHYSGFTAVNYVVSFMTDADKIAPFDKEDDAKELRDHVAKTQDMHKMDVFTIYLVLFTAIFEKQFINLEVPGYVTSVSNVQTKVHKDSQDDAEIAEIKRAAFSALTWLRAATIKEFDTVAQDVPGDRRPRQGQAH